MMEGWCRDQTFRELVLEFYFWQTTAEIYTDDMSLPKGVWNKLWEHCFSVPDLVSSLPREFIFLHRWLKTKIMIGPVTGSPVKSNIFMSLWRLLRLDYYWPCQQKINVPCTYIFGFKCCVEWTWLWIMFLAFSAPMSELAWTSTWQTLTDFPKVLITRTKK